MTAANGPETARKAPARRAPAKPKADPAKIAELETELGIEGAAPPADVIAGDAMSITTTPRKAGRRVVIFYVDGKPYSVPESPPANIMINYSDTVRKYGAIVASSYLMEVMLGTEGYDVLRSRDDMTEEQLAQVMTKIIARLGEAPKE